MWKRGGQRSDSCTSGEADSQQENSEANTSTRVAIVRRMIKMRQYEPLVIWTQPQVSKNLLIAPAPSQRLLNKVHEPTSVLYSISDFCLLDRPNRAAVHCARHSRASLTLEPWKGLGGNVLSMNGLRSPRLGRAKTFS
ncbi:uncharacterized protein MEPE_00558 [Melanopsichium pennsylvanicum]|uniref:Uncharacterized protein n=1 Tax=Melanopsichium pennsylvanicum TaxID=63383 RepID=A0AAJ5C2S8_9BASI|nr:uncharacterized protein MEPE_00558 [Melanopsichium pennsylvanicum]